jgi:hypothetical protein
MNSTTISPQIVKILTIAVSAYHHIFQASMENLDMENLDGCVIVYRN